MKKLAALLVIVATTFMFVACIDEDETGSNKSYETFEGTFALTEMKEEHLQSCNYTGDHTDNQDLYDFMYDYINTDDMRSMDRTRFTFSDDGTYTADVYTSAPFTDNYIMTASGTYEKDNSSLTLTDSVDTQHTLEMVYVDSSTIVFPFEELEVEGGQHEGCMAVYSFVFTNQPKAA